MLFEVGIGNGAMIASGLNHEAARGRPEGEWLIARLLEYAAGQPHPKATWPASFLPLPEPPPPGPHLSGFQRLLLNQGEESVWYSYREDNAKTCVCRQTGPGNLVQWETAAVPADSKQSSVTFVFAGGLGYSFSAEDRRLHLPGQREGDGPIRPGGSHGQVVLGRSQSGAAFPAEAARPAGLPGHFLRRDFRRSRQAGRTLPPGRSLVGQRQQAMVRTQSLHRREIVALIRIHYGFGQGSKLQRPRETWERSRGPPARQTELPSAGYSTRTNSGAALLNRPGVALPCAVYQSFMVNLAYGSEMV